MRVRTRRFERAALGQPWASSDLKKYDAGAARDEPTHDDDITQVDKAKLELRRVRRRMKEMQKKYEAEAEKFTLRIKREMRAGRKDRARVYLRLRKLRETALERTDNQIINLEKQLDSIREQQDNIEYVRSLQTANSAMEELQKIMPVEYVEDAERNQELQDINVDIEMLGDGICAGAVLDRTRSRRASDAETEIQGTQDPGFTVQDAVDLPVAPNNPIGTGASKTG